MPSVSTSAQQNITVLNTPVIQDFNALPATGNALFATGGIFAEGWSFLENGTNKNDLYQAGSGTSATGDTYSFGASGMTDRGFGFLQSGSLGSIPGYKFQNNTGQVISSMVVGYTGELWRLSAAPDGLTFSYQVGDVALDEALGWRTVTALNFITPVTGTGAVDGNSGVNRIVLNPVLITGLSLPPGAVVTFRWVDATLSNSAAMAIDDFSLVLIPAFTGYFRSRGNGSWNEPATWENSLDGNTWTAASNVVPCSEAAGTTLLTGHAVSVTDDLVAAKITVQPGGKLAWTGGKFSLEDTPGDDLVLQGTGSEWEMAANVIPVLAGTASVRVGSGAILKLAGNNNLLAFHGNPYTYADKAIFEYSHTTAPIIAGPFFSSQENGAIPVFRYNSPLTTAIGNSSATTINGSVEVAAGRTFNLNGVSGPLIIRNGIAGDGNLSSGAVIQLTGSTAILGGAGTLNSNLSILQGCTTTLISNRVVSNNRTLSVSGILDAGTRQLRTSSGTATLNINSTGTVRTANAAGLIAETGSLKTGNFSLSLAPGSTVEYNAPGNQDLTVTNIPAYQNLVISGTGIKTAQSGGNLIVQGACRIESGATFALSGNAAENLYLNNNALLQVLPGGTFDNGGESSITSSSGTPSISIAGTFITRDRQGFIGTGAAIPTINPQLLAGSLIDFGCAGDQSIQATLTYENLSCSGTGIKTPSNAIAVNGTIYTSGAAVLDGTSHTIGGTTTNLVMKQSSRLIVGSTGTQPAMGGMYTLSPGTAIEFANNNLTTATMRQGNPVIQYANVEIAGNNVTAPLSGITLQAGATLQVKSGGTLKLSSVNGLYATANAAVLSLNNPAIDLQPGSTVEYNGAAQTITTAFPYSSLTIAGSGNKTALAAPIINQRCTRSGTAEWAGASPVYAAGASLVYADGEASRTYTPGLEWPVASPPQNITVNLTGTGSPLVRLATNRQVAGNLTLAAGALSLEGFHLEVTGSIMGNGTLNGSETSALTLHGGVSNLQFTQVADGTSNALGNLVIRSGNITLGNKLQLYNVLDLAGGTLDLADKNLVLKSGPTQTARVTERKGILLGATRVTVERFVKGAFNRRWRLLTAPVSATTINEAWQEGRTWNGGGPDNLSPGYGTLITGQEQGSAAAANAKGFDFWPGIASGQASIRRYLGSSNFTAASWQPLPSTFTAGFTYGEAYLLFVRGDRSVTSVGGGTVLRATGALKENFEYTIPINPSQSHTVIGNPFASPLHFRKIYEENNNNIKPYFWIWQAGLSSTGGYALVRPEWEGSTTYEVIPYGGGAFTAEPVISSGEGFFVVPSGLPSATNINIRQAHKAAESSTISVLRQTGEAPPKLYMNLHSTQNSSTTLLDGIMLQFGKPGERGNQDAIAKAVNNGENLSVFSAGKDWLLSEADLPAPGTEIQLRLWNTTERAYTLQLHSRDFNWPGGAIWLWDRYIDKRIPLTLGNAVTDHLFTITSDPSSRDPFRFRLIFEGPVNIPLPLRLVNFSVREKAEGLNLEWKMEGEEDQATYELERSATGLAFQKLATIKAKQDTGTNGYEFLDRQPLQKATYRLKILHQSGKVEYSPALHYEKRTGSEPSFVYANPVRGGNIHLRVNNLSGGLYTLTLYSGDGKKCWQQKREHSGGTTDWSIDLGQSLPAALYKLVITSSSGKTTTLPVQVLR
ncbi:hypothetical protein HRG84_22945 [Flavisolibacter sp. BT320]|nr:hypothetical protein [Flavisolibacter longurius]